ncbi:Uncharacterized conserved protein [Poseidonocella pacifica]|uniref:Uncharacterized conserved protein n=1 Tax=Poseidonocella pacifica TaxID=871651 RepID=A0A1I0UXD6_9RHOB|nr:DUF411 domain-containing protein [Poseidonocella pacifica]SFA68718.1 Uncharacterized conserved protein [Poseidonocella pacifica]
MTLTRRAMMAVTASFAASVPAMGTAQGRPAIHVLKDPNCGCCTAWIEILREDGFAVTTEPSFGALLMRHKLENGIPQNMTSCHTGEIEGYMIEGHVPPADIRRLVSDRPDAVGLAVPGMPYGSPGMGPEDERDAYDVFLIRKDGSTEIFASYDAA